MKKIIFAMAAAGMLSVMCAVSAFAGGWKNDGGGFWYEKDDGSYYSGGIYNIDGTNYCFNSSGYMVTGWQQPSRYGAWYFFEDAGNQAMGWKQSGGKWYYLDPANNGAMKTGWFEDQGVLYYLDPNQGGAMQVNSLFVTTNQDNGEVNLYQADANGGIIRNKESKNAQGTEMKYMDDGAIMYRSNLGKLTNANDGGWHWAHSLDDLTSFKSMDNSLVSEAVEELKQEWASKYEDLLDTKNSTRRQEKIKAWEERVKKAFNDYVVEGFMSDYDITVYIRQVKNSTYDPYADEDEDDDDDYFYDD
ncbi:MAG: hypothetical protein IJT43_08190 [Stomatobaculum sp.]|nr:hypothetical protein [Stomatobaculum sp.]